MLSDWMHNAFAKALEECGVQIVNNALNNVPRVGNLHYSAFTEYGRSPIVDLSNTIDSTAVVVDDDVKLLPAPDEAQ
jgi:hypothetical protein